MDRRWTATWCGEASRSTMLTSTARWIELHILYLYWTHICLFICICILYISICITCIMQLQEIFQNTWKILQRIFLYGVAKSWRRRNVNRNRPTTQLQIKIESISSKHTGNNMMLEAYAWNAFTACKIYLMLSPVEIYWQLTQFVMHLWCITVANEYLWCWTVASKYLWCLTGSNMYLWCLTGSNMYLWCLTGASKYLWCLTGSNMYLWCLTGAAPKVCQWLSADCCKVSWLPRPSSSQLSIVD